MTDGANTERFSPRELELLKENAELIQRAARMRGRYSTITSFLQGLRCSLRDESAKELIDQFLKRDAREPLS